MDDRKRGFTNRNYGNSQNTNHSGQYSYQYNGNDQAAFNEVIGFINAHRYQEALNILEQIRIAENGVGNNITAVEYAQTALQMEPNNLQYLLLLQQLKGGQRQYQSGQQSYSSPFGDMSLCYNILLCSCLLNCCC